MTLIAAIIGGILPSRRVLTRYRLVLAALASSLVVAGTHRLEITATASSGKTTATRSTITVAAVPTALVGTFKRTVSASVSSSPHAGVWTLHVRPNGVIMFDDPWGSGGTEAFTAGPDRITLQGFADRLGVFQGTWTRTSK